GVVQQVDFVIAIAEEPSGAYGRPRARRERWGGRTILRKHRDAGGGDGSEGKRRRGLLSDSDSRDQSKQRPSFHFILPWLVIGRMPETNRPNPVRNGPNEKHFGGITVVVLEPAAVRSSKTFLGESRAVVDCCGQPQRSMFERACAVPPANWQAGSSTGSVRTSPLFSRSNIKTGQKAIPRVLT